jgi:hypothetical protein
MDFDSRAPVAEIAGGLARRPVAILERGDERARDSDGPPPPKNPAEVLALLMDFAGSVELAKMLHAPAASGPSHPDATMLARKLQDKVRAKLDAVLVRALKPLAVPRADPTELLAAITRATGEPGSVPDGASAARLARDLGEPLRQALGSSLRQAQAQLAPLRWDITHELRALGPRAARLERIDAALQRSISAKLTELFDRLELAAELTFERACSYACSALPETYGVAELAGWAGEGGWLERYRERCERMAQAFFGHLRRSLEGLMLAAIHAEAAR